MSEHMSPIPSRLYNAAVEGHVAGADQIIDDETGLTLDKIAGGALEEKTYTSGSDNGMGRVVLRKNLVNGVNTLVQTMINQTNTIYVIQYDFTLGENINIPENCVLEFDGGSLSGNGENKNTITAGKTLVIKSDKKCFSNILFSGNCCDNHFHTKWFTNPTRYGDKTYDHSDDLQALFDCGVQNIHFDDGFYYITKKLTVIGNKDFYTDHENNVFAQKVDFESASVPTIYADTIVTMLEYTFKHSYTGTNSKRSIYLGAIHFICDTPYTEVTQASTEIPIIKVVGEGMLWRADIYISIKAPYCAINTPNGSFNALNYTGMEFYSHTGYMTCIRLYGDIIRTYNGYRCFTGSGTWFTLIELFSYTDCVRGIDTDVEPLIVHNGHQANTALEIFGNEGYFSAPSIYDDESFVFDLAHGTAAMGDRNVWYKCYPSRGIYIGHKTIGTESFNEGKHMRSTEKYPQGVSIPYTEIADKTLSNILYLLTSADNDAQNGNVFTWSYKINNVDIASFTEGTIYNMDKLFTKGIKGLPGDRNYAMKFIPNAYVAFSEANKLQKIEFAFKASWVYLDYFRVTNDILYKASTTGTSTCILEIFDNSDNLVATVNMNNANNSGFLSRVNLMNYFLDYDSGFNFKFTVTFTASPAVVTLPFFALTKWGELRDVDSLGSIFRLPTIPNNTRKGFNYYDTTLGKPIWWNGTAWIDATGTSV